MSSSSSSSSFLASAAAGAAAPPAAAGAAASPAAGAAETATALIFAAPSATRVATLRPAMDSMTNESASLSTSIPQALQMASTSAAPGVGLFSDARAYAARYFMDMAEVA
ncbi:hypothetical protein TCDM_03119 [Trypanosoma cruzi Dm28c]|uniref:Uncharacterized protein n=1 Tax=Trypanosoma cruzi Dm28c TaxID=1416333 RepID=V5B4M6_TRYCR|nr:hypothetical protein TCDM_03119 [Trypanosoma cruzi Dm28c]